MSGKSGAGTAELLSEGLRCEKAGLVSKALDLYREARRDVADPAVESESWRLEAYARHGLCQWDEALAAAQRSAELARQAGRPELEAEALNAEAAVHLARGDLDRAAGLFEAMLDLTELPRVRGLAHQNLGIIHGEKGDRAEAERRFRKAYLEFEAAGYSWGRAHVLNNTVALRLKHGDLTGTEPMARQAIREAQAEGDMDLLAIATLNLAELLAGLGRFDDAESEASTALGHFNIAGNRWRRIACFRILGDMNAHQGDHRTARGFWTRGLELAREIGATLDAERLEERLAAAGRENGGG